jgi:hypothetical protein
MAVREVDEFQSFILENAVRISRSKKSDNTTVSKEIRENIEWIAAQSRADCSLSMDTFGKNLHAFCSVVDCDHPYLNTVLDEHKIKEKFKLFCEAIKAADYLKKNDSFALADLIRRQFTKNREVPKDFNYEVSRPSVRILKNESDRLNARKIKKPSSIPFATTLESVRHVDYPDNFKSYHCGYDYIDELNLQEKMFNAFEDVQVTAFSRSMSSKMEYTKKKVSEQYYGFVRLKMIDAAIILAKSIGLSWADGIRCIQIGGSFFPKDLIFWSMACDSYPMNFKYQPNKYPLYAFDLPMPSNVQKILNLTESYPSVSNKPIFDHYWVVCPSFHLDSRYFIRDKKKPDIWTIRINDEDVNVEWDKSKYTGELSDPMNPCSAILDKHFTKSGFVTPIVLGERNGECFFLCYWC